MFLPVGVQVLRDSIHDPLCRFGVGKYAHGPRPSPDLPEGPLQDVGGAEGSPEILGKTKVMETMEQIFLQTAFCSFGFIEPLLPPGFEAPDRFPSGGGGKDREKRGSPNARNFPFYHCSLANPAAGLRGLRSLYIYKFPSRQPQKNQRIMRWDAFSSPPFRAHSTYLIFW